MSVRNTRSYVTEAVSRSCTNFNTFVFLSICDIFFEAFVLTYNSNHQIVSIVTSSQTVSLVIFVSTSSQGSVAVECIQVASIQDSMFSERTSVATEEARIFIVQAQVVRCTAFHSVIVFIARVSIVTRLVLYACAETTKYRGVVTYRYFTRIYTFDFTQLQSICVSITRLPRVEAVAAVVQSSIQVTDTNFTETTFQAQERFTVCETRVTTGDRSVLFNLPNSIQVATQVFVTFETDTRTEVSNLSSGFRFSSLTCNFLFGSRNFYTSFDLTVQSYVSHSCNRQSRQSQGNQRFFHCCIPFLL